MKKKLFSASVASVVFLMAPVLTSSALAAVGEQDALGQSAPSKLTVRNESDALVPRELFGAKGGYFHPFISATALSSDNIYNNTDKVSDWLAVYSPGIWLAVPARKDIFLNLNTNNTSPGGHLQELDKAESFSRYQSYAMYAADINDYHNHSDLDHVKQSAEGFFQVNLRGGLSIDMFDKFLNSQDPLGTGDSGILDKFTSNLLGAIADYDLTEKFKIRLDYTNFDLRYDLIANEGRDRTDNSISPYLYYKYSDKTSLFFQFQYIDLDYKLNDIQDSKQYYTYAGMNWRPSGKTTLKGKVGVAVRDANLDSGDKVRPALELTADYKMTGKTTAQVFLAQKIDESTVSTSDYSVDKTINFAFTTQFTAKIGARLQFGYMKSNFEGGTLDRDDDIYNASLIGAYALKEWLKAEAGYQYQDRDSSIDSYDYSTNQLFARVSTGF